MANEVTIKELLEAGTHFGHQRHRWNPKMRRYIFEERDGLYIIDLAKTLKLLEEAKDIILDVIKRGRSVLFVGTKQQAKIVIRECAQECSEFFVCERWLGGMLTNMTTIRQSIKKLERIERNIAASTTETSATDFTKKEISQLNKLQIKLDRNLSGVRNMKRLPGLVFVVDPGHEKIAVAEAKKLGIPVMAIVDTDCDPDPVDYVIPGNDDALKSIKLIVKYLTDSISEVKKALDIADSKEESSQEESDAEDQRPAKKRRAVSKKAVETTSAPVHTVRSGEEK